jgi:hypothetical protein
MTITRDDLEDKLREVGDVVDDAEEQVIGRSKWVIGGLALAAVLVVGFAIWRSRQDKITIEVYRQ